MGEVAKPGFHPYTKDMDVIKAVSKIGGLTERADWSSARIMRMRPNGEYAIVPLDLNRLFSAADMPRLYSGVTNTYPSNEAIFSDQAWIAALAAA